MSSSDLAPLAGLFAVGVLAAVLNVIAGGGSFLTLPVLIFLGLPAGVANPGKVRQLEAWQDKFLREFVKPPFRHSVRAGHGVGKDVVLSILALWFVLTHYDSKCVITGASQDQLRDTTWPEIRKWWRELPPDLAAMLDVQEERINLKSFCLITAKPTLYAANVDEKGFADNPLLAAVAGMSSKLRGTVSATNLQFKAVFLIGASFRPAISSIPANTARLERITMAFR